VIEGLQGSDLAVLCGILGCAAGVVMGLTAGLLLYSQEG
jgi:hypothetical protein